MESGIVWRLDISRILLRCIRATGSNKNKENDNATIQRQLPLRRDPLLV
jgi:hypothetical protein